MVILMEQNRKIVLGAGTAMLIFIIGFIILIAFNSSSSIFYWGLLVGVVFGIGTCIYLAEAWDPIGLQPTNPNTSKASWNLLWVVPLGVFAANILSNFISDVVGGLLLGCLFSWLEITFGYLIIQAWRYRPK
ncbi:hypothetical protein MNBD_CHLOROFLEXI01-3263 [hydrothermal vent metagenome]|uniref:Uncharacterized protein n=1 Tax=hydrothermal vent metagenome TaxID=652676 RepID=A0A3B0VHL3_9ZZZZ